MALGFKKERYDELKVFCVGSDWDMKWIPNAEKANSLEAADVVIMPGGADWNPALYAENKGRHTHFLERTDEYQLEMFIRAVNAGKFIIGICRGAQLLGIAMGGNLFQDVNHHAIGGTHLMFDQQGNMWDTNSLQHQMVNWQSIPNIEYRGRLLMWAESLSTGYLNGDDKQWEYKNGELYQKHTVDEPEVFQFNTINALGVQGHPEMPGMPEKTIKRILTLLSVYRKRSKHYPSSVDTIVKARFDLFAKVYPSLRKFVDETKTASLIVPFTLPDNLSLIKTNALVSMLPQGDNPVNIKIEETNEQSKQDSTHRHRRFQGTGNW